MADKILITLDDLGTAVPLNAAFEAAGFSTNTISAQDDARSAVRRDHPALIIVTGSLYEAPARALVTYARDREVSILALLEPTDTEGTNKVAQLGVTEVMIKPVRPDEVVAVAQRLIERRRLQERTGIVGESAPIQEVLVRIEQMAPVSSTVLIQGESGTGKELVAKGLHDLSSRRGKAFIAVNCGALPETLLESELFGHEKGSFTGAAERRLGRFELADGGTLFLDEIGETSPAIQVKLLRVLETRTFYRVGGTQAIKVDVRVLAATNRNLRDAVTMGEFREDLFYRLNVLNVYLPPLRERRGDIPLLVRRFIREFSKAHDRHFRGITPEAMDVLVNAPWPGNIRQLRNLIESMVVLAPGAEIRASDIPRDILEGPGSLLPARINSGAGIGGGQEFEFFLRSLMELKLQVEELRRRVDGQERVPARMIEVTPRAEIGEISVTPIDEPELEEIVYRSGMTMAEVEKAAIAAALKDFRGNRRRAAEQLGIGERTLYRKIRAYNLDS
jgi:DNA-binding NtrC family response regulator